MLTRLLLLLVRLICLLPLGILAPIGQGMGMVLYFSGRERRNVARINLERCFPDWSPARRRQILRAHFRAAGRALLEQGILWWSSKERIERTVGVEEWFNATGLAEPKRPLWKKMSIDVAWVYPTALFFSVVLAPLLVKIPLGLRVLTSIAAVTVVMQFVVGPIRKRIRARRRF